MRFLKRDLVEKLHKLQIDQFGGSYGLRDARALESDLSRPINKNLYGCDDLVELAAAYLYGLAMNHAFIDGNKRIAIVAAGVFLLDNGVTLEVDNVILFQFVLSVAAGEIDEDGASRFLRDFSVPVKT